MLLNIWSSSYYLTDGLRCLNPNKAHYKAAIIDRCFSCSVNALDSGAYPGNVSFWVILFGCLDAAGGDNKQSLQDERPTPHRLYSQRNQCLFLPFPSIRISFAEE